MSSWVSPGPVYYARGCIDEENETMPSYDYEPFPSLSIHPGGGLCSSVRPSSTYYYHPPFPSFPRILIPPPDGVFCSRARSGWSRFCHRDDCGNSALSGGGGGGAAALDVGLEGVADGACVNFFFLSPSPSPFSKHLACPSVYWFSLARCGT